MVFSREFFKKYKKAKYFPLPTLCISEICSVKLRLHDAIYLLRFYSNSLTHILSLSNLDNNVASIQENRGDKLHHLMVALRRISCHGKNHSHTRCEYSETIFLCYHHYSEYSLLGSKFSTNLLFAASKTLAVQDVQNDRRIGWLQWWNIAGSLYQEKEASEKDGQRQLLDRCSRKY